MKQSFKKVVALVLILVLALGTSMPVFADEATLDEETLTTWAGGKINITGSPDQLANQTITIMRILDIDKVTNDKDHYINSVGSYTDKVTDPNEIVDYSMNLAWLPFAVDQLLGGTLDSAGLGAVGTELETLLNGVDLDMLDYLLANVDELIALEAVSDFDLQKLLDLPTTVTSTATLLTYLLREDVRELPTEVMNLLATLLVGYNQEYKAGSLSSDGLLQGVKDLSGLGIVGDLLGGVFSGIGNLVGGVVLPTVDELLGGLLVGLTGTGGIHSLKPADLQVLGNLNLYGTLQSLTGSLKIIGEALPMYVEALVTGGTQNRAAMQAFAEAAESWLGHNTHYLTSTTLGLAERIALPDATGLGTNGYAAGYQDPTDGRWENIDAKNVAVIFEGLSAGKYIIDFGPGGLQSIMVDVPSLDAERITLKMGLPTIEKLVSTMTDSGDGDNYKTQVSTQIGKTVTYQMMVTIPAFAGSNDYTYKVVDTMDKSLQYVDQSVRVYRDSTATDRPIDPNYPSKDFTQDTFVGFNVEFGDVASGTDLIPTLTLDFGNLASNTDLTPDADTGGFLRITYEATLLGNANVGSALANANVNNALIVYGKSTDPKKSLPSTNRVYTYKLDIMKVDRSDGLPLDGAEFFLNSVNSKDDSTLIPLYAETTPNTYRIATSKEIADPTEAANIRNKITTPIGGKLTVNGLAGTYYLVESKEPTHDGNGAAAQYTAIAPKEVTLESNATVTVANGNRLNTGGAGTVGLTILGVLVIAGGVVFVTRKPRKKTDGAN